MPNLGPLSPNLGLIARIQGHNFSRTTNKIISATDYGRHLNIVVAANSTE